MKKIESDEADETSSTSSREYVPEIDLVALRASLDPAELAEIDAELAPIKSTIIRTGRFLETLKQRHPGMEFPTRLVAAVKRPSTAPMSQGNPRAGTTKPMDGPGAAPETDRGRFTHHTDTAAKDAAKRVKWLVELKGLVGDLPQVRFEDRIGHLERLTEQLREYLGDRERGDGADFHGYLLDVWTRKLPADVVTAALEKASAPGIRNAAGYFLTIVGKARARQRPTAKAPKTSAAGRENQETPLLALS